MIVEIAICDLPSHRIPEGSIAKTTEKMLLLVFRSQNTAASLQHMASTLGLSKQVSEYHARILIDKKFIALSGMHGADWILVLRDKGRAYVVENNLAD
jgi:hypothetical protein